MTTTVRSDYYDRDFNTVEIGIALRHYLEWCKNNGSDPEVTELSQIDAQNVDHVLYHAEIEGYVIDNEESHDPDEGYYDEATYQGHLRQEESSSDGINFDGCYWCGSQIHSSSSCSSRV